MKLPENKRRNVEGDNKKKIWLYGAPFSGKTYLANQFPDPLMLNTDGNVRFIDAPYIAIKDEVTVEGRITKRKFAWETFKEAIAELEKKQNDFKTIVVDLLEDTYEHARLYVFNKNDMEHESDGGFGKGWDLVKTEFLSTIKRLMNLDYENIILISHEDTSKDITKKGGDKLTSVKPNINEKAALKIAGMVDLVARVIDDGGKRCLSFKTNEVVFGGGRLKLESSEIPCEYELLCEVYHKPAHKTAAREVGRNERKAETSDNNRTISDNATPDEAEKSGQTSDNSSAETVEKPVEKPVEKTEEEPRRRRRRA